MDTLFNQLNISQQKVLLKLIQIEKLIENNTFDKKKVLVETFNLIYLVKKENVLLQKHNLLHERMRGIYEKIYMHFLCFEHAWKMSRFGASMDLYISEIPHYLYLMVNFKQKPIPILASKKYQSSFGDFFVKDDKNSGGNIFIEAKLENIVSKKNIQHYQHKYVDANIVLIFIVLNPKLIDDLDKNLYNSDKIKLYGFEETFFKQNDGVCIFEQYIQIEQQLLKKNSGPGSGGGSKLLTDDLIKNKSKQTIEKSQEDLGDTLYPGGKKPFDFSVIVVFLKKIMFYLNKITAWLSILIELWGGGNFGF